MRRHWRFDGQREIDARHALCGAGTITQIIGVAAIDTADGARRAEVRAISIPGCRQAPASMNVPGHRESPVMARGNKSPPTPRASMRCGCRLGILSERRSGAALALPAQWTNAIGGREAGGAGHGRHDARSGELRRRSADGRANRVKRNRGRRRKLCRRLRPVTGPE